MGLIDWDLWQWLTLLQHELLLFAGVFFLIGALDDICIDLAWVWLKLKGQAPSPRIDREALRLRGLSGPVAVFIPTWKEAAVIADTVTHMLEAWPQRSLRLYVGCYRNDPDTIAAVMKAAAHVGKVGDARLRIVIHDRAGPSTKADCLNRLHKALRDDERRSGKLFSCVVFHDAEDMVDPAALSLLDAAIADGADFVQLPVEPLAQSHSRWLGSHYCEEFAEAHGKGMVVRSAFGAALPAAGVGCAVSRRALHKLSRQRIDGSPFEPASLTEDYELGLAVSAMGGTSRFIRARAQDGTFVATRAYFPEQLGTVVRQKTRWVHGIALQGWDRIGWHGGLIESWMRARDRRGPLTALVLFVGYVLLVLTAMLWIAVKAGWSDPLPLSPFVIGLLYANLGFFGWRAAWRFGFTVQTHGWVEGIRSVLRIPLTNVIAIIAGRRAVMAYLHTLAGRGIVWDKTPHKNHPAQYSELMASSILGTRLQSMIASAPSDPEKGSA